MNEGQAEGPRLGEGAFRIPDTRNLYEIEHRTGVMTALRHVDVPAASGMLALAKHE
jgi:hypothetical protein